MERQSGHHYQSVLGLDGDELTRDCHDHKYDPIPTKDYYRLVSVFASTKYHPYPLVPKAVVDEYGGQEEGDGRARKDSEESILDDLSGLYAFRCYWRKPNNHTLVADVAGEDGEESHRFEYRRRI